MATNLDSCRRLILISVALLVGVALVQAVAVIPPVKAAPDSLASPKAVPAFWLNVGFQVLFAVILFLIAVRMTDRIRSLTVTLGFLAFFIVLLGLALTDAGSAYRGDSHGLTRAAIFLYVCAVADLVAAVLVVTAAFLIRRST